MCFASYVQFQNSTYWVSASAVESEAVKYHSKITMLVMNIFAKCGLCSSVFTYEVGYRSVNLNLSSFNAWLEGKNITPLTAEDLQDSNAIAKKIDAAIGARGIPEGNGNRENGANDVF